MNRRKYPEFILRKELAEISGVNYDTIKKYSDFGILPFIDENPRRYQKDEALQVLKEIKELKKLGYSLKMIKKSFTDMARLHKPGDKIYYSNIWDS